MYLPIGSKALKCIGYVASNVTMTENAFCKDVKGSSLGITQGSICHRAEIRTGDLPNTRQNGNYSNEMFNDKCN
jgi:hypothetical protein